MLMPIFAESSRTSPTSGWRVSFFPSLSFPMLTVRLTRVELAACGIGIHHAGMSMSDRRATEELYLKKLLRIVFATSVSTFIPPAMLYQSHNRLRPWRSELTYVRKVSAYAS